MRLSCLVAAAVLVVSSSRAAFVPALSKALLPSSDPALPAAAESLDEPHREERSDGDILPAEERGSIHRTGRAGLFGEQPQLSSQPRPAIVTPIEYHQQAPSYQITPDQIEEVRYSAVQTSTLDLEPPEGTVTDLETSESVVTPAQYDSELKDANAEYDPYQLFPPSFHELLDIPIHVYKNGTEVRTLRRRPPPSPMVSGGYANTQVQGYGATATGTNTPRPTTSSTRRPTTLRTTTAPRPVTRSTTTKKIKFVTTTPRAKIVTAGGTAQVGFGQKVTDNQRPVTVKPSHELNERFSSHSFGSTSGIRQSEKSSGAAQEDNSQSKKSAARLSLYEKLKKRKRPGLKTRDRVPFIPRGSEPKPTAQPRQTPKPVYTTNFDPPQPAVTTKFESLDQNSEKEVTDETEDYVSYDDQLAYDDGYPAFGNFPQYAEFGRRRDAVKSTTTSTTSTTTEAATTRPSVRRSPVYRVTPGVTEPTSWVKDTPLRLTDTTTYKSNPSSRATTDYSENSSSRPRVTEFKTRKPWAGSWTKKPVFEKPQGEVHTTEKFQKPFRVTQVLTSEPERHGDHYHEQGSDAKHSSNHTHPSVEHTSTQAAFSKAEYEGGFRPQTAFPSPEETSQSNYVPSTTQKNHIQPVQPLPGSQQSGGSSSKASSTQEPFQPFFPDGDNPDASILLTESPNLQSGPGAGIHQLSGPKFGRPPPRGPGFSGPPRRPGSGGGFSAGPNRPRPGFGGGQRPPPGRVDGPPRPAEGPQRPFGVGQRPGAGDGRPVRRPRPRPTPAPAGGGYLNSLLNWFRGGKDDGSLFDQQQQQQQQRPGQQALITRQDSRPHLGDQVQGYAAGEVKRPAQSHQGYGRNPASPGSDATYTRGQVPQFRPGAAGGAGIRPSANGAQRRRGANDPLQRRRFDLQRRRGSAEGTKVNTLQMMHPKLSRPSVAQVLRAPLPEGGYLIADPSIQLRRRRIQRPGPLKRPSAQQMPPSSSNGETMAYQTRIYEVRPSPTPRRRLDGIQDRVFLAAPTMRAATLLDDKRIMVVGPFVNPPPGAPHINYPEVLGSSTARAKPSKTGEGKADWNSDSTAKSAQTEKQVVVQGRTKIKALSSEKASNSSTLAIKSDSKTKLTTPKSKTVSVAQSKSNRKQPSKTGTVLSSSNKNDYITVQVGHSASFGPAANTKSRGKSQTTKGSVLPADLTSHTTAHQAFGRKQASGGSRVKTPTARPHVFKTSKVRTPNVRTSTSRSWPAAFFRSSSSSRASSKFGEKPSARKPADFHLPKLYSGFEPMLN